MPPVSPVINVMIKAARRAAGGLIRDYGEVEQLQVSMKGPADFVSTADLNAEKKLFKELSRARPGFGFLMEERGAIAGTDPDSRWIVDPLDGTMNFLHGLPHFAISIGLEEKGEIIAGVVYEPLRDEMFHAEKGKGAFLNDHRLRVSGRRKMEDAVIATGLPAIGRKRFDDDIPKLSAVMDNCAGVRRFGAASLDLAYVAAGRYEGFWERGLKRWDIAAGIILVREAGGYISNLDGGPDVMETGDILASNDHLHQPLQKLLKQATAPSVS